MTNTEEKMRLLSDLLDDVETLRSDIKSLMDDVNDKVREAESIEDVMRQTVDELLADDDDGDVIIEVDSLFSAIMDELTSISDLIR